MRRVDGDGVHVFDGGRVFNGGCANTRVRVVVRQEAVRARRGNDVPVE